MSFTDSLLHTVAVDDYEFITTFTNVLKLGYYPWLRALELWVCFQ